MIGLIAAGFLIGAFVAILGGGGGVFYVPVLTIFFHVPTNIAVGTSLATVVPTTLAALLGHARHESVDFKAGFQLALGGALGAYATAFVVRLLSAKTLALAFGIFMFILAFLTVRPKRKHVVEKPKRVFLLLAGIASGAMAGIFGASGSPPVIAVLSVMGFSPQKIVGTSILVLCVNAIFGALGHWRAGHVDIHLFWPLALGALCGAFSGALLLHRLPTRWIERYSKPVFLTIMIAAGIGMLAEGLR
jgi:uncharacterized membrane protein YfcA